jgi:hypothetical protein
LKHKKGLMICDKHSIRDIAVSLPGTCLKLPLG